MTTDTLNDLGELKMEYANSYANTCKVVRKFMHITHWETVRMTTDILNHLGELKMEYANSYANLSKFV